MEADVHVWLVPLLTAGLPLTVSTVALRLRAEGDA